MSAVRYLLFALVACVGLLMAPLPGSAQDPQFTQFYAGHMYLNPALTGYNFQSQINTSFRAQWPGSYAPGYNSSLLTFDYDIPALNSGMGFLVLRDKAGDSGLSRTKVSGMYSYLLSLTRNHHFRFGMEAGYAMASIDYSGLVFGDQLLRDGTPATIETFATNRIQYLDLATGGLFYTERYWVGVALHHLNTPRQTWRGLESRLDAKYSAHAGYTIPLKKGRNKELLEKLLLAANYKAQGKFDQFDLGMYYYHKPLMVGLWYRGLPFFKAYQDGYGNSDALSLLVGVQHKNLRVGYSYDFTVSKLTMRTAGAHEITLALEFKPNRKKRQPKWRSAIPCPDF